MNDVPMLTGIETKQDGAIPRGDDEPGFGALATGKGNLPLEAIDVRASIVGLLSHVRLSQTFVNAHAEALEATYVFPLPDRAAVTKFVVTVAGRTIEGVLKERGEARRDYDAAITAGHRAAIAEEERPGTFTMRVGNLMAGEKAVVHLEMTSPLPFLDGEATFRFPLVVAPRYIPGVPLGGELAGDGVAPDTDAVPDASRISPPVLLPGFPNPVRLSISVDVDPAGLPLRGLRSSLHAVEEVATGGASRTVTVKPGDRANRDFILRLALGEKAVTTSLVVTPDADGEGGTFALTLVPPTPEAAAKRPRDVVFVLDRSGSMGGWKMVAARRAVARMVDTLDDHDRFTVYAFDDRIETPPSFGAAGLVPATNRNRFRAVEFLAKVDAEGGTELDAPLRKAVGELGGGEAGKAASEARDRHLVLVTDGQVGNEDQILRSLGRRLAGIRVFTVGIDRAVNEGFLKRLAASGGGSCEIVESEDRLDETMDRIHRRIGTPIVTGLSFEPDGLSIDRSSVVPIRHDALFAGAPRVISGRYRGKAIATGGVHVRGRDAAGLDWSARVPVTVSRDGAAAVRAVWARERVRELEDRYAIDGSETLEREIVTTSLGFGVLCRFTAFLAVDTSEVVNAGGENRRVTQPVDAPEGWAMFEEAQMEKSADAKVGVAPRSSASASMAPPPPPMEAIGGCMDMDGEMGAPAGPVMQAPSPSSPQRKSRAKSKMSIGGGLGAMLGRRGQGQKDDAGSSEPAPIDLGPYRARAQAIRDLLGDRPGETAPSLLTLGTVAVQLAALLEDLRSVDAPASEVEPLARLLEAIRTALLANPDDAARTEQGRRAADALATFAGGTGPRTKAGSKARSSRAFWK